LGAIGLLIPLHVPELGSEEADAVRAAVSGGNIVGNGAICRQVQALMQESLPARYVVLTTSCTHAMELAALAIDLGAGDEVILPSYTFPSTANAIALRGALPVFADIDPETLTLDPEEVQRRITPRTRAIMPVHYAGVINGADEIADLAAAYGLQVIEDAAQAWGSAYRGRRAGVLGSIGCFSFHATKNVTCGEGGAFVTNDDELFHAAEIAAEKGTNRNAFMRGEVDRYTWVSLGSSYVLSDILASLLLVQLRRADQINETRRQLAERYAEAFRPLETAGLVRLPVVPPDTIWNAHCFYLRLTAPRYRDRVIAQLRAAGVGAAIHFVPLHTSPFGTAHFGGSTVSLPHTDQAAASLIRLPLYTSLTRELQDVVIAAVQEIVPKVIARE
jgi:dTDP-4-amino-4,6-dideoxygalactose transaminase